MFLESKALIGRTFLPEEDRTPNGIPSPCSATDYGGGDSVADPTSSDKKITLNEHDFTIIGRRSKGFRKLFCGSRPRCLDAGDDEDYVARPHFFAHGSR